MFCGFTSPLQGLKPRVFLTFLDVLWGNIAPRRLISCENTYFLEVFADGTAKIPHFLGFEDPVGSIL